jgi:hypothetical protein
MVRIEGREGSDLGARVRKGIYSKPPVAVRGISFSHGHLHPPHHRIWRIEARIDVNQVEAMSVGSKHRASGTQYPPARLPKLCFERSTRAITINDY